MHQSAAFKLRNERVQMEGLEQEGNITQIAP